MVRSARVLVDVEVPSMLLVEVEPHSTKEEDVGDCMATWKEYKESVIKGADVLS